MKAFTESELFSALLRSNRRWGLLLALTNDGSVEEIRSALPAVLKKNVTTFINLVSGHNVFLTFKTEQGARRVYESVVGEDGPTKRNKYYGPVRVYACLYGPTGKPVKENT